jgi:hypothetical protein
MSSDRIEGVRLFGCGLNDTVVLTVVGCPRGTFGPTCAACPEDSVCVDDKVTPCGPGKTAPPNATDLAQCVCLPGYGGSSCDPCGAGSYRLVFALKFTAFFSYCFHVNKDVGAGI